MEDRSARFGLRWERTVPLAPALLGGAHLSGLLLFLNPHLPLSVRRLAFDTLLYGALFALPSFALFWLVARRRGARPARLLPWSLVVVTTAGALGDWVHASFYAFYLPPGINVQLIKTALWLTLGSVLLFYTALLHTLHKRPYGPRSLLLVALVALGTVYAMFDRRTSFRPSERGPRRVLALEAEEAPRAVVVELPGATLDALLPLAEQGRLPGFRQIVERGAVAPLAGFAPVRPLALRASWATAKLPFRHGLTGATVWEPGVLGLEQPLRLLPLGVGFAAWGLPAGDARPISAAERTALPVWEILARAGRRTLAVGFDPALGGTPAPHDPVAAGARSPSDAERLLAEANQPELLAWLRGDLDRLEALRAELVSDPPHVAFVSLSGLEQASLATFGGFVRAEFEASDSREARRAADALVAYLAGLDGALAGLWEAIPPPRLLALSSAYGTAAPGGLSRLAGGQETAGTMAGPPDGVLLLRGEGIRPGVQIPAASVLDVAPTLLYALGLPSARDFDGRVLAEAFEPALLQSRALGFVPSFEGLRPVRRGRRRAP